METRHKITDEPEPAAGTSDDQSSSQIRSYECNFCKRGFSNAQALGGHMNIHRKDRAKLKQPTNNTHLPFDITDKISPSFFPVTTSYTIPVASDAKTSLLRSPWSVLPEVHAACNGTHESIPRQLPLFIEKPHHGDDRRLGFHGEQREEEGRAGHGELDLELRLGPEPTVISLGLKESV